MKSYFESFGFVAWLLVFIFVGWAVGTVYGLFFSFWWYDVLLHFLGGFWVFVFGWSLYRYFKWDISGPAKRLVLFTVFLGIVTLVGVLWEFFELVLDRYILELGFTRLPRVFEDTLADLFWDLVGGSFAAIFYFSTKSDLNYNKNI